MWANLTNCFFDKYIAFAWVLCFSYFFRASFANSWAGWCFRPVVCAQMRGNRWLVGNCSRWQTEPWRDHRGEKHEVCGKHSTEPMIRQGPACCFQSFKSNRETLAGDELKTSFTRQCASVEDKQQLVWVIWFAHMGSNSNDTYMSIQ